jgi:phosphatidylglycerophosphatase A
MRLSPTQRRAVLSHPAGWIASGFGSGLSPIAPGTMGSLVALPLFVLMQQLHPLLPWLGIVAGFALGVWAAGWVIRVIGVEDPGVVVIDEFVGQWLTLAMLDGFIRWGDPFMQPPSMLAVLLVGFVLFRLCDIIKPWPASWADRRLHGGFGSMLDDAIAGLWAGGAGVAALLLAAR